MIEKIWHNKELLSIIVRNSFRSEGIEFFTDSLDTQQLGYMNRPKGYKIQPHVHKEFERTIYGTSEVLYIKTGKVRIDYYSSTKDFLESKVVGPGDVILLIRGGHGFEMLSAAEIIEVKQGPYCGEMDKERFQA